MVAILRLDQILKENGEFIELRSDIGVSDCRNFQVIIFRKRITKAMSINFVRLFADQIFTCITNVLKMPSFAEAEHADYPFISYKRGPEEGKIHCGLWEITI
jgi:hypothetical protein